MMSVYLRVNPNDTQNWWSVKARAVVGQAHVPAAA